MMDIITTLFFFFLRILKVQGKNSSSFSDCAEKTSKYFEECLRGCKVVTNLNIRKKIIEFGFRYIKNYAGSAPRSFHNSS